MGTWKCFWRGLFTVLRLRHTLLFFVEVSLKLFMFLVCHVVEITCLSLHVKNTCFSAHLFLASRSAASAAADVGALYTERASPPAKQKQIGFWFWKNTWLKFQYLVSDFREVQKFKLTSSISTRSAVAWAAEKQINQFVILKCHLVLKTFSHVVL